MHLGSRCPSRPVWCQPVAAEAAAEPSGQRRHPPVAINDQAHSYGGAVLTGHEEVSAKPVLAFNSLQGCHLLRVPSLLLLKSYTQREA